MKKNSAQEKAILHNQGPMMLLAGPGSGLGKEESLKRIRAAVEKLK